MLSVDKCGEGGESKVLSGDVPGVNVVIKIPKLDFEGAMEETHFIEFIYDWLGYKAFVVEPREELIVRNRETKKILFYCACYERIR